MPAFRAWRGADLLDGAGSWTSPVVRVPGGFTELVPTWNASTPPGSRVTVQARAGLADGTDTGWLPVARWASDGGELGREEQRTTFRHEPTALVRVDTDTVVAQGESRFTTWQLRVTGQVRHAADRPQVGLVAAVTTDGRPGQVTPSAPSGEGERQVAVPRLSQQRHRGHRPEWDGGGESWCSPTSVSMVLRHWGAGPGEANLCWVEPHDDPGDRVVEHAVRGVWDATYGGAGNWAFNTAFAATFGLETFVTRLRSLRDAEAFVAAGIPLVASVRFTAEDLPEAGYATSGHLLVVCGVTAEGDVLVNDPASHGLAENDAVPAVFGREAFERAWLGGSAGTVYVIRPPDVPLPARDDGAPW